MNEFIFVTDEQIIHAYMRGEHPPEDWSEARLGVYVEIVDEEPPTILEIICTYEYGIFFNRCRPDGSLFQRGYYVDRHSYVFWRRNVYLIDNDGNEIGP